MTAYETSPRDFAFMSRVAFNSRPGVMAQRRDPQTAPTVPSKATPEAKA